MKYYSCLWILNLALTGTMTAVGQPHVSRLWLDYEAARRAGTEPELADFSYAGYHTGTRAIPSAAWKVFNVTDFGAVANDDKSDKEAVIAAIRAAEANGSGIIYFPPGRFRLNDESDPHNQPIHIRSSNIVLRGSGSGEGGTELFFERHMDPADPKKLWTCPYAIQIVGKGNTRVASAVVADARRETFSVQVAQADNFQPGDWVELAYLDNSPAAVAAAVAPHAVEPAWKTIINKGVEINEIHRIKAIDGATLTLMEPIHASVEVAKGWMVRKLEMLQEIGIEDLAFVGNWHDDFVHHKDAIHDGGWSCIEMARCANSWIRDCRFTDWNRPLAINRSAAITVQDIVMDGTPGHSSLTLQWTCHSLVQRLDDRASHWHAAGVAKTSSGNVFLRSSYADDTCFESHASQPRWTLLDNIAGGWKYGRWGGALVEQPNHLEGLIFWNYRNTGQGVEGEFRFMLEHSVYGRIIMPYVIGFHGNPQQWVTAQIKVLESNGAAVYPESLYEAQLKLRLALEGQSPP
jgi:hypothetical protein